MGKSTRLPNELTLSDVARRAGVSAQTVSRVVNGKPGVSEETYARVSQVIAELRYRPNIQARNLATRVSKTIGLIVTDFAQGFFPDTSRTIEHVAGLAGYAVSMMTISDDEQRIGSAINRLRDDRFAGLIVNTSTFGHEEELHQAFADGFPIVLIHEEAAGIEAIVRWPGFRTGAATATDHLISIGRRKIAYLATKNGSLSDRDKIAGYQDALTKSGLPFDPSLVIPCFRDFRSGYAAIGELLLRHPDIDGVLSASDVRAVGALRYLALHNIPVPDQIAIVGFGASTMASMVTPSLSTVRVPRALFGQYAVESLLDQIAGNPAAPRVVHEQPELILGESSILPRAGLALPRQ